LSRRSVPRSPRWVPLRQFYRLRFHARDILVMPFVMPLSAACPDFATHGGKRLVTRISRVTQDPSEGPRNFPISKRQRGASRRSKMPSRAMDPHALGIRCAPAYRRRERGPKGWMSAFFDSVLFLREPHVEPRGDEWAASLTNDREKCVCGGERRGADRFFWSASTQARPGAARRREPAPARMADVPSCRFMSAKRGAMGPPILDSGGRLVFPPATRSLSSPGDLERDRWPLGQRHVRCTNG
jgi:hypothetical protein